MSLLKLLGTEYNPTAAFSFEFFKRDSTTKELTERLGEVFFLLPPEEYSMTEGYKVTITKTPKGGWVDDFGNDFKQLKLSGSLYTYYTGYPLSEANIDSGAKGAIKNFVKRTATDVARQGKRLVESATNIFGISVPGMKGMSGLEEFYKLRYIVSRMRDEYIDSNQQKIISQDPRVRQIDALSRYAKNNRPLYDKIGILYHDYDDNNHFEVIFTNLTFRRSKDDPHSVIYTIEMTCLKETKGSFIGSGKVTRKENPVEVLNDFENTYSTFLNEFAEISNIPNQITELYDDVIDSANDVYNELLRFKNNIVSNSNKFVSYINNAQTENNNFEESLFTSTSGVDIENHKDETYQLDEDLLNIQKQIDINKETLSHMKGTEKYYSLEELEKTYNIDNKVLEDTDFDSDAEEKQDNVFTSKDRIYYQVKQNDTAQKLAYKFYGTYAKASIILEANNLKNSDFENDALIGSNIVIPLDFKSSSKVLDNNLVYFKRLEIATDRERQLQILGNDLNLNTSRELFADGSGDIAIIYGENCYLENIQDRIKFPIGTLSPINPTWGIELNIGDVPLNMRIDRILRNIETQIQNDPRTEISYIDEELSDIEGDTVKVVVHVKPFAGEDIRVNASDIVNGVLI